MPGYSFATSAKVRRHSSWRGDGVGLVGHDDALLAVLLGPGERGADDALDALAGVDFFAGGDLVEGALLEEAALRRVLPFGVLAEDDEVDLLAALALERREPIVEQRAGAEVDVEVEPEAQAQQDLAGVGVVLDAGVADGAEEDGVVVAAEGVERPLGQGHAGVEVALGAVVEAVPAQAQGVLAVDVLQQPQALLGDLDACPITRDDRDACHVRAPCLVQGLASAEPSGFCLARRFSTSHTSTTPSS